MKPQYKSKFGKFTAFMNFIQRQFVFGGRLYDVIHSGLKPRRQRSADKELVENLYYQLFHQCEDTT